MHYSNYIVTVVDIIMHIPLYIRLFIIFLIMKLTLYQ